MAYEGESYVAQIDVDPDVDVECNCGWKGKAGEFLPIEDCALTPGDPSPAGRCPHCECIAYLPDRPLGDFVQKVTYWNSGGNCMIDLVHLKDGRVIGINDECVVLYANIEEVLGKNRPVTDPSHVIWF